MYERLSLRLRIFLFFAFLGLGGAATVILGLWVGYGRVDAADPLSAFVMAGVIGGLGILGLAAWVWLMFDENVAKPILKLAGGLRTHAHAKGAGEIDQAAARYLGDLAPAAQALTADLADSKGALDDAVEKTTRDLADEKAQLTRLLAGVPSAIVLCSADHRVVFYNGEAAGLLDGAPPHLGRSLFESLRNEPVQAAYDRLRGAGDTEFVCGTLGNDHTLHIRMRRADTAGGAGYALVLRPLGRMSRTSDRWPTTDFPAEHLLATIRRGLEARGPSLEGDAPDLHLRGDPLQLAALAGNLISRIAATGGKAFSLLIDDSGAATITLGWSGEAPDPVALAGWLEDDIDPGVAYVSGRSVLDLHRTDIELVEPRAGRAALRFTVPRAVSETAHAPSLRAVFDFAVARPLPDSSDRLRDRVFVVFDSETTGLDPNQDEVVQLAAVRMVNGRIVAEEAVDTLVDPERKIPTSSTKVHGISDDMVQGAPKIDAVGRRFHHFAQGAVLVAHNAPFDMAFLTRHESRIGRRFDHPVLDTVLLSAILYGQSDEHSLDALIARLGVSIPEELRHTAMGDARGTAEALERMIPMLEDAGLETLSDVIAAARKHGRLLKDLN